MTSPKISVCIPTFRRKKLLMEAIDSVVSNGFDDYEIIVSDDDGDPKVKELVSSYQNRISQPISYYAHSQGQVYENWSFATAQSRGEYVFKLDDDDLILPGFLAETISFLDRYPQVGIVFTAIQVSYHRKVTKVVIDDDFFKNREVVDGEEYSFSILRNQKIPRNHKSTGVFRRYLIEKIDYFNTMRTDVMFTIGIASLAQVGYIPKVYFEYRFLENQKVGMSYHDLDQTLYSLNQLFLYSWIKENLRWKTIEPEAKRFFYYVLPVVYTKDRQNRKGLKEAIDLAKKFLKNYPEMKKNKLFCFLLFAFLLIPKRFYRFLLTKFEKASWHNRLLNFFIKKI